METGNSSESNWTAEDLRKLIGSFSDLPPFVPRVPFACLNDIRLIFTLAEIFGWHNYCFTSPTSQLSTQRAFLMRSFVCNYFSPGHHIPTTSHHLPTVKGVFETRAFRPFIFSWRKERGGCQHLAAESASESKQLKGSGTEGCEGKCRGLKWFFFFSSMGGRTVRRSYEDELCLFSLTSRRRKRQTLTVQGLQLQEGWGQPLAYWELCRPR